MLEFQAKSGNPGGSVMTPTGQEMARMHKENKRINEEVEILKKKRQRSLQKRASKVRLDLFS